MMGYGLNGDPDLCTCEYHESVREFEYQLFERPSPRGYPHMLGGDTKDWDFLRRMARKMGHVAWARLCQLPIWNSKVLRTWRGLQGVCSA